jgi:hypothetical protein
MTSSTTRRSRRIMPPPAGESGRRSVTSNERKGRDPEGARPFRRISYDNPGPLARCLDLEPRRTGDPMDARPEGCAQAHPSRVLLSFKS